MRSPFCVVFLQTHVDRRANAAFLSSEYGDAAQTDNTSRASVLQRRIARRQARCNARALRHAAASPSTLAAADAVTNVHMHRCNTAAATSSLLSSSSSAMRGTSATAATAAAAAAADAVAAALCAETKAAQWHLSSTHASQRGAGAASVVNVKTTRAFNAPLTTEEVLASRRRLQSKATQASAASRAANQARAARDTDTDVAKKRPAAWRR
jgi:hypothetical protein